MILTLEEIATYAPDLASLTDAEKNAAILSSQLILESAIGGKIEQQSYTEQRKLNSVTQSVTLAHRPILSITSVELRAGNAKDRFGRFVTIGTWQTIDPTAYALDASLAKIHVNVVTGGFSFIRNSEVKVTYTAGLDFTQDNAEINGLKAVFGQILNYQQSDAFKGIDSVSVPGEFSIKYSEAIGGMLPKNLTSPFRKYINA